jgi:farnesyl diphosphate synthase
MLLESGVSDAELQAEANRIAAKVEAIFSRYLAGPGDGRDRLFEAMRHAGLGGGKRIRPLLTAATGRLFGLAEDRVIRAGAAIEAIHVYSLIHDDLPCMDDDDLRRGKPTVHRAFDESTAVLAGDCFHDLAFEIIADPATHEDPFVRAELAWRAARCWTWSRKVRPSTSGP